uniref:All-trans retinoic acid-induced differentiation factor n=1 Tax=Oryzias sinensis TaxID=183150 RepID=A0A8C7YET1_9TELE
MNAVYSWTEIIAIVLLFNVCFSTSYRRTETQVCALCGGSVNNTAVDLFCSSSAGRIKGRCCLKNNSISDPERIIGLDLSNCSLTHVDNLQGVSTVEKNVKFVGGDLTLVFTFRILPPHVACPGGNTSWEKVELKDGKRLCEGQKNMCNQTGHLSVNCPENSLCAPYGPGFSECSCAESFYGYKCLRQGDFPALVVFGPLAASTVVMSLLLWVTQRRKAKNQ